MACGLILWDFDGTLVDRPGTWSGSLLESFQAIVPRRPVSLERIRSHTSKRFPWHEPHKDYLHLRDPEMWWGELEGMMSRLSMDLGASRSEAMAIARDARARILDPRRYSVFPDVRPALAELSGRGWRHAVLSNNHPDLEPIVAALRLGHFEAVFTSALIGYEKPRREIFQYALERLAPTGPVWMIGDNEIADARGAEAAGLKAVLVRKASQGFHRSIPDLTSLPDLVHESVLADCE